MIGTQSENRKCYPKFMQSKFDSRLSTQLCSVPCGFCSSSFASYFPSTGQIWLRRNVSLLVHSVTNTATQTTLLRTNTRSKRGAEDFPFSASCFYFWGESGRQMTLSIQQDREITPKHHQLFHPDGRWSPIARCCCSKRC